MKKVPSRRLTWDFFKQRLTFGFRFSYKAKSRSVIMLIRLKLNFIKFSQFIYAKIFAFGQYFCVQGFRFKVQNSQSI